jgi:hypothetical protein
MRDTRYDYLYSKESLQKVKGKIEKMAGAAEKTFVAAKNHPRGQVSAKAVELKSLLSGKKVSAPDILIKTYSALKEFAVPESIEELLPLQEEKIEPRSQRGKARKSKSDAGQQDLPL